MPLSQQKRFHHRNIHNGPYDFKALVRCEPQLGAWVFTNQFGNLSIDFANPNAVLALNKALLAYFYRIETWSIPKHSLCPPIPGRADYIHHLADLLSLSCDGRIPKGSKVMGLDIGVGANCIYPLLGHSLYGWDFVGSDCETKALSSAQSIIDANGQLNKHISCRLQTNKDHMFKGIIQKDDLFDFTLCNPPFHKSEKEAFKGTLRKITNLSRSKNHKKVLNFGGEANELWYPGGEIAFITKMIKESQAYHKHVLWFTTLVSKAENLSVIYRVLKEVGAKEEQTIEMSQGNKNTRIVAWSFLSRSDHHRWVKDRC